MGMRNHRKIKYIRKGPHTVILKLMENLGSYLLMINYRIDTSYGN